jgi:hypothetical protein
MTYTMPAEINSDSGKTVVKGTKAEKNPEPWSNILEKITLGNIHVLNHSGKGEANKKKLQKNNLAEMTVRRHLSLAKILLLSENPPEMTKEALMAPLHKTLEEM